MYASFSRDIEDHIVSSALFSIPHELYLHTLKYPYVPHLTILSILFIIQSNDHLIDIVMEITRWKTCQKSTLLGRSRWIHGAGNNRTSTRWRFVPQRTRNTSRRTWPPCACWAWRSLIPSAC